MFRIIQKIKKDFVDGDLLDTDKLEIGFVEDEFFAQEFCSKYSCCRYEPIIPMKYPNELREQLCPDEEDLILIKIPVKKKILD